MRLYQIWLGGYDEVRTLVLSFRAMPHRSVWDQFVRYRSMLASPWAQKLRLVSNPDWFPDTPENWPDATTFLNQCFASKRNIESLEEVWDHWKSFKPSREEPQEEK